MAAANPIKLYKGSVDEVFSHRDDIPPGAILELRVYPPADELSEDQEAPVAESESALAKFGHLFGKGTATETDLAERDEHYLNITGFGETKNRRELK
jgi:hypothetical protein